MIMALYLGHIPFRIIEYFYPTLTPADRYVHYIRTSSIPFGITHYSILFSDN